MSTAITICYFSMICQHYYQFSIEYLYGYSEKYCIKWVKPYNVNDWITEIQNSYKSILLLTNNYNVNYNSFS